MDEIKEIIDITPEQGSRRGKQKRNQKAGIRAGKRRTVEGNR